MPKNGVFIIILIVINKVSDAWLKTVDAVTLKQFYSNYIELHWN